MLKKISVGILAILLAFPVAQAIACEYHGNAMFGAFGLGGSHPLAQRTQRIEPQQIKLEFAENIVAQVNDANVLDIKYTLPGEYQDVSLIFTSSAGLTLGAAQSEELVVNNGSYALDYEVTTPGEHHIEVTAKARLNGYPYLYVQRVYLTTEG